MADNIARGLALGAKNNRLAVQPHVFYDLFDRPDTLPGSLGTPAVGSVYDLRGVNALSAATGGRISGGRWVTAPGEIVYAVQDCRAPVNSIGARIKWAAGNAGSQPGTFAMLVSPVGGSSVIANAALHCTITRSQFVIQQISSSSITTIRTVPFTSTIPLGVEITAELRVYGNTVAYAINGYTGSVINSAISDIGLGNFATFEHYYASSSVSDVVSASAIWAGATPPVPSSSMLDVCNAAWKFENTNWLDSSGQGHTLTPNTASVAIATAVGHNGNGAQLIAANTQYFSSADHADYRISNKRETYMALWWKPTSVGVLQSLLNKGGGATLEYELFMQADGTLGFGVSPTGSAGSNTVTTVAACSAGAWHFIEVYFNPQTSTVPGSIGVAATPAGSLLNSFVTQNVSGVFTGTSALRIGNSAWLGGSANGIIDDLLIFSTPPGHGGILSQRQRLRLYNEGAGLQWPF